MYTLDELFLKNFFQDSPLKQFFPQILIVHIICIFPIFGIVTSSIKPFKTEKLLSFYVSLILVATQELRSCAKVVLVEFSVCNRSLKRKKGLEIDAKLRT